MAEPQAKWKNKKHIIFLMASVLLLAVFILLSSHKPYDNQEELKTTIPGSLQTKLVVEIDSTGSSKTDSTVQKAMLGGLKAKDLKKKIYQTASSKNRQKGMYTSKLPATGSENGTTSSVHSADVTMALQRLQTENETKVATKMKDLQTIRPAAKQLTMQPKAAVFFRLPSGHMVTPERLDLPESSSDVFLSVKTGGFHEEGRLSLVFLTWMQTINPKHVRVITDSGSGKWFSAARNAGIQVVETHCLSGHGLIDLCCKSGNEFAQFYAARDRGENYKWYCHVDNDMYVNVPTLIRKLHSYNPSEKRYLGHNLLGPGRMTMATNHFRTDDDCSIQSKRRQSYFPNSRWKLWQLSEHVRRGYCFADGPCYCMSALLMDAAKTYYRNGDTVVSTCQRAGLPDDVTVGFINDVVLDVPITHVPEIHTERSPRAVPPSELKNQITFGYSLQFNVRIDVPNGRFDRRDDPSGMLSYHCLLYPQTQWCSK